ncbi:hypothetical protein RvY_14902 [Ramazzottius varieornatus]|uniref:UDP-glucuronosyltransferase n=1 Tax=Ramazzottius varieornatus TaxID=947166 RepID=A0A1D1W031_RAMVA|nr:hypothetical protein RvY_14902 [Ramazzottius varieornatus]
MAQKGKHFLLLPDSAFGHIIPMLELARHLADISATVTFAVSALLVDDMCHRDILSREEEKQFNLYGIEDGVKHTLDEACTPKILMDKFELSAAGLNLLLNRIPISGSTIDGKIVSELSAPVDAVIVDILLVGAIIDTCRTRRLSVFAFSPFAGTFCYHFLMIREDAPTVPDEMFMEEIPLGRSVHSFRSVDLAINRALLHVDGLLINSFRSLEPQLQTMIDRDAPQFSNVRLHFVGPSLPVGNNPTTISDCKTTQWLNMQEPRSVVYFSFGSIAAACPEQIKTIAEGLLSLKKPFIWSLRLSQQCHLPAEILQPTDKYLIVPWVSQKAVLAHEAVRVFISHCGWNSTLEGLSNGVPIVAWPFFGDQFANAGLVVRSGCGVRVPRRVAVDQPKSEVQVPAEQLKNLIDQVAQWEKTLEKNEFFVAAQSLRKDAREALSGSEELSRALSKIPTLANL